MRNLEGLRNVEVSEKNIESKSITVNDDYNSDYDFSDCKLTEKNRLLKLREEILDFSDCAKEPSFEIDEDYDFEDCRRSR